MFIMVIKIQAYLPVTRGIPYYLFAHNISY